jgi:sRNA-binding carbon storage regulator CsrA
MGLVISRAIGQRLRLTCPDGTVIWVGVIAEKQAGRGYYRKKLHIEAPQSVEIVREELIEGWTGRVIRSDAAEQERGGPQGTMPDQASGV